MAQDKDSNLQQTTQNKDDQITFLIDAEIPKTHLCILLPGIIQLS